MLEDIDQSFETTTTTSTTTTPSSTTSTSTTTTTSTLSPQITDLLMSRKNHPKLVIKDSHGSMKYSFFSSSKTEFIYRCDRHSDTEQRCSMKYKVKPDVFLTKFEKHKRKRDGSMKTTLKLDMTKEKRLLFDKQFWKLCGAQPDVCHSCVQVANTATTATTTTTSTTTTTTERLMTDIKLYLYDNSCCLENISPNSCKKQILSFLSNKGYTFDELTDCFPTMQEWEQLYRTYR